MDDENKGDQATSEPEEQVEETPQEEESVEEVKGRLSKAEELANNYKIRAEKAEKAEREAKKAPPPEETKPQELTSKDVLTLANEGITNEEDVDFAEKWAKFNDKPVREAIKDATFKAVLSQRQEERKTAQATQTKGGARGTGKVTGEDLLAKAQRGHYPESEEDIEKMIAAKFEAKKRAIDR